MTAATEAPAFEPGIYDMPEDAYHADPVPGGSLSASGAKRLLPPSCPALFRWYTDHPVTSQAFDIGTAAHRLVLGAGAPLAVLDAEDWRTKAAKEWRDAARAEGCTPLLKAEHDQVQAMAAAIRQHPVARVLFDPERGGHAEQSLFWCDYDFGTWRRARVDWLPDFGRGGRPVVPDYKTAACASPAQFGRTVANFGYHQQAAWYTDAVRALTGVAPSFVFVVQEKAPPWLVTVCELDTEAIAAGRALNEQALEIYRDCTEAGVWPGYSDDIELISLPAWARPREDWS